MSKNQFELYVKTKLDILTEDHRELNQHHYKDDNILDILLNGKSELNFESISSDIDAFLAKGIGIELDTSERKSIYGGVETTRRKKQDGKEKSLVTPASKFSVSENSASVVRDNDNFVTRASKLMS